MWRMETELYGARTALDAMAQAGFLAWNVRKERIFLQDEWEIKDYKAIVRDNPSYENKVEVLAVGSNQYRIIQNESNASVIDSVVSELDAIYQSAAQFKGGVTVLELSRLSKGWISGRETDIFSKLCIWNSHNRTRTFSFEINLLNADRNTYIFSKSYKRLHRSKPEDNLLSTLESKSKRLVAEVDKDLENFILASQDLGQFEMSVDQFSEFLASIFIIQDSMEISKIERIRNLRQEVLDIFRRDPRLAEVRGTAWSGYLAITMYLDGKLSNFEHAYLITPESKKTKEKAWLAICDFADSSSQR